MADFFLRPTRSKLRNGDELPDILARDYIAGKPNWDVPIWKDEWQKAMDKQLAHISYIRNKSWDHRPWVPKLKKEFRTVWRKFRAALHPKYKKAFTAEIARCRRKAGFTGIKL